MNNKFFPAIMVFMLSLGFGPTLHADNLGQFDARSMAMGGTGVGGAKSANASAFNPALIATEPSQKRFSFIFPTLKVNAFDENGFVDRVEDAEDSINGDGGLDELLDGMNNISKQCGSNPAPGDVCYQDPNMQPTALKAREVRDNVVKLNNSNLLASGTSGLALQFGKRLPMAFFIDGGINGRLGLKAAQSDFNDLLAYTDKMEDGNITYQDFLDLEQEGLVQENNGQLEFTKTTNGEELNSLVEFIGGVYYEFGLSLADSFSYMDRDVAVGITPKIVKVGALKFHQGVEAEDIEGDDILDDDNINEKTDFNADVGIAVKPLDSQPMQVGLTIKNLFTRSYALNKTPEELALENIAAGTGPGAQEAQTDLENFNFTQKLAIEPQFTAGLSYSLPLINLAADLDLNAAEVLGKTTQHLGLGAEFDARFAKLQVGYRTAVGGDKEEDAVSAGVGLGPFGFAVVGAGDNYGAVMQFGFSF